MNKTITLAALAAFTLAVLSAGPTMAEQEDPIFVYERDGLKLQMEVHTAGRLQSLDHSADDIAAAGFTRQEVSSLGFQHAIGNIGFRLLWEDYLEVFFDATMASRVHADRWWGHQGYMLIKKMPEDSVLAGANAFFDLFDIKAGQFVVDFGNEVHRRSLNADVQRNPLVGNPIVSPHATEVGLELIHDNPAGYGFMVGVGSGVATENFSDDARLSTRAKVWIAIPGLEDAGLAGSYYRVKHGPIAAGTNLFRTDRLGGQYAGIWDGGASAGQVFIGNGLELQAWQLDADWSPGNRAILWGHFGRARDIGETWSYYGVTGQYYLIPDSLYLAARFSAADASRFANDPTNDGDLQRWQVGGGVVLLPRVLLKVEYVNQRTSGFQAGAMRGVQLDQNPKFDGVISEVSFSF